MPDGAYTSDSFDCLRFEESRFANACYDTAPARQLNVTQAALPPFQEFIDEIACLWESHWLTNMGQKHHELQRALEEMHQVDACVLFANGHSALQATLEAMELHGEVITTPFTFSSTTHAIVRAGLTPVMCDVKTEDGTLDPTLIEPLVTERTCAILPVHVYGNVCDTDAIQAVADHYGLRVVYDAAHAFGERYNNASVASFGDASILSFHATKVFNSVEGGAVCLSGDDELRQKLELLRNFGIVDEENVQAVGFNAKMSELHAAMGLCNLRHHAKNVARRRHALMRYQDHLSGICGLRFVSPVGNNEHDGRLVSSCAYCAIAVSDEFGTSRDGLHEYLAAHGIHARKYFYPCTNAYTCYKGLLDPGRTPVAKRLSKEVLCLPLFAGITDSEVDYVCNTMLEARSV